MSHVHYYLTYSLIKSNLTNGKHLSHSCVKLKLQWSAV